MQAIMDQISQWLQEMNTGMQMLLTMAVSMVPVIELRGAIPLAAVAGLPWYLALPSAVVGNMLPVPFILLFIRKIFHWLRAHTKLGGMVDRLEERAEKKIPQIKKYEWWGLMIFVAIPLPGTGGWSGTLIAALMDMRLKKAVPSILLGVLTAGIVMILIAYGVF